VALAPPPGSLVVDMCASPGSKTGLLAQLVGRTGLVLGNEPNPSRLATLRRNLNQLNLFQAVTCCHSGDALPLPDAFCDHIMLDPPCSGWGTTDKHPKVMTLWKDDKVRPLIGLQRALLAKAASLLRPGGRLVYSTCTTNVEENEAQTRYARDELGLRPVPLEPLPGFAYMEPALPDVDGVLRIDEAESEAQGFFIAAFTRDGTPGEEIPANGGAAGTWEQVPKEILAHGGLDDALLPPGVAGAFGDTVHMLPDTALALLPPALRWQGAVLGKYGASRFRPSGRIRACLREDAFVEVPRIDAESLDDLLALTQGRSLSTGRPGKQARLFWRGLPLGMLTLKNGRAVWSEK